MRLLALLVFVPLALLPVQSATVFAQDDDWLNDFDDPDSADDDDEVDREEEGDSEIDMSEDPDALEEDWLEDESLDEESLDEELLDEEEDWLREEEDIEGDVIGGEGVDNARIYRATLNRVREVGFEEELIAWESYLDRYPRSVFRERIEARIEALHSQAYDERIGEGFGPVMDAGRKELDFAQAVLLEPLDPRSRVRAGFEWGFPSYFNLMFDFEYQIFREMSVHAGQRRRYTGWSTEVGARYAVIKSVRTKTILTGIFDLHFNNDPTFLGVRPQLAFGKRFDVGGGLDLQFQVGAEFELRDEGRLIWLGGFNAFYQANETVGVFLESSTNMKEGIPSATRDFAPFAFNVLTIGMRFQPSVERTRVTFNSNVPYFQNYWGYHYGAVQTSVDYYL